MVAPIIYISFDSSEDSVGSCVPRVILFGAILAIIPVIPEVPIVLIDPLVAPEVESVSVVSLVGVLDLVDYSSSSNSVPSEDSLPPVPDLPLVSPSGLSSHDTLAPSSEFPFALIVPPPEIRPWLATLIRPGEAIPFGRLYCTYSNGPHRHSSPDSSSSRSPLEHSLSRHTPPDTIDADSSTPQRFVHRSLARTPRHSEAFRHWRSAPLSTPYPPITSKSSLGSSFERDLYSPKDSEGEQMEVDTADAEAVADVGISNGVVAHTGDGVGMRVEITASDVREDDKEFEAEASTADTREIAVDPLAIGGSSESSRGGIPDLKDTIYDIVHFMSEVRIDRITEIETTQRQLEASKLVASGDALTWWNSHTRTIGTEIAFSMSWRELMKLMTEVYCLRNEVQKMESELWNLTEDRIERYVGGLPDNIQGNVMFAEPTRLQDAIRLANNLMDQKLKGYDVKNAENKRRLEKQSWKQEWCCEARGKAYVLGEGDANPDSNVVKGNDCA
nr:hypothetical protein [Tanacetum cinerariifolium]